MNVLLLCYGNTCRSPMAEVLAREIARRRGLPLSVSSAGITDGLGRAHEYSVQAMRERGLDLNGHRARVVNGEDVRRADLIFALDRTVQKELVESFPEAAGKTHLLKPYAFGNGAEPDVRDPYPSHNLDTYRRCAEELRGALEAALERIAEEAKG